MHVPRHDQRNPRALNQNLHNLQENQAHRRVSLKRDRDRDQEIELC